VCVRFKAATAKTAVSASRRAPICCHLQCPNYDKRRVICRRAAAPSSDLINDGLLHTRDRECRRSLHNIGESLNAERPNAPKMEKPELASDANSGFIN
jgi:hypothetical protein